VRPFPDVRAQAVGGAFDEVRCRAVGFALLLMNRQRCDLGPHLGVLLEWMLDAVEDRSASVSN